VQLLGALSVFLLAEAEKRVLIACVITHRDVGEASSKSLQNLLLSFLDEEELHVTADGVISSLVDSNEVAPIHLGVQAVVHDLALAELGFLFEHFGWSSGVVNVGMIHVGLAYDTKLIL
jgi:hypothetical protein